MQSIIIKPPFSLVQVVVEDAVKVSGTDQWKDLEEEEQEEGLITESESEGDNDVGTSEEEEDED